MQRKNFNNFVRIGLFGLVAAFVSTIALFNTELGYFLRTSVVGIPEHEPFAGLTYPFQEVPDWVSLKTHEYDYTYREFADEQFMAPPVYDPNRLRISTDDLVWGDEEDNQIRNEKITYSAYMGNYKLDGIEYGGSHPAVDIKLPEGTPIVAIGNGTVIKAVEQSTGFGHHVVLQHNNFPTLEDENAKETVYSSYSHMGRVDVTKGDVVRKGQIIGTVSDTGTATNDHIHFQIDNDSAPWHPFWPFTWQEADEAGYNFFEAINAGLGQEAAIEATINPIMYIQKYLDVPINHVSSSTSSYVPKPTTSPEEEDNPAVSDEPEVIEDATDEVSEEPEPEPVKRESVLNFDIDVSETYHVGSRANVLIKTVDQYGDNALDKLDGSTITLRSDGKNFSVRPGLVDFKKFASDGTLSVELVNLESGQDRVRLTYNNANYYSSWFDIEDGDLGVVFSDIPISNQYYNATKSLYNEGVIVGYKLDSGDRVFKPREVVSRVESLKFVYEAIDRNVKDGAFSFKDTDRYSWYGPYVYTAVKDGVVKGYEDGTFRPGNTVTKAEFFKILFKGMGVDVPNSVSQAPFADVPAYAWHAPFITEAKKMGIIDPDQKYFSPDAGMTRGEAASAMVELMKQL